MGHQEMPWMRARSNWMEPGLWNGEGGKGVALFERFTDWTDAGGGKGHYQTKYVYIAHCSESKVVIQPYRCFESTKKQGKIACKKEGAAGDELCLGTGNLLDGCMSGFTFWRSLSVTEGEQIRILNPDSEKKYFVKLETGSVKFGIAAPHVAPGEERRAEEVAQSNSGNSSHEIILESTRGLSLKRLPAGCYCCARGWNGLTPFTYTYSHNHGNWVTRNHRCMIAWRMIGNYVDHDSKGKVKVSNAEAQMFTMVPEFILAIANAATLTLGQHALCAMTCQFRKIPEFDAITGQAYSRSYTKVM